MYSADRLREVMRAQGRQVNWLAEITEYAPESVSRFLTGSDPISDRFAQRAARCLGIPLDWLRVESPAEAAEAVTA